MTRFPVRLSHRHEYALRLIALGMPCNEAAALIGISPNRMAIIYRSPVGQSFVQALYAMANDYTARMLALGLTPRHLSTAQGGGDPDRQVRTAQRKARREEKVQRRERKRREAGEEEAKGAEGAKGAKIAR